METVLERFQVHAIFGCCTVTSVHSHMELIGQPRKPFSVGFQAGTEKVAQVTRILQREAFGPTWKQIEACR